MIQLFLACMLTVPEEKRSALLEILTQDPRPSYQDDPERIYGMRYAGLEIRFRVADGKIILVSAASEEA